MSELIENGVNSQQPLQGAILTGPQQHHLRHQHQSKHSSSSNQQGSMNVGHSSIHGPSIQSDGLTGMGPVDESDHIVEHHSHYNKQDHRAGHIRGSQTHRHHNSNNMSQHHKYTHSSNYSGKNNTINNNNNNQYINAKGDNESNINHVLLITVINPHYPITCEIIHLICSNYGKVNRIVIFKKNGVQAMVEFDNVESAKRARSLLHGCDIYSGCCTLKVEFAKPTRLNVHKNDNDSFDYTNPSLGHNVGSDDSSDQQPNVHHHHHHQPTQHHGDYQNHSGTRHSKGSGHMNNRRNMGGGDASSNFGGHHEHHVHHTGHFHSNPPKHHLQHSNVPPNHHLYSIASNQSSSADSPYQQQDQHPTDEGFGISRTNAPGQATNVPGMAGPSSGHPDSHSPGAYTGADPFAMTSASQSSHNIHTGSMFSRHESSNSQHHHHHHHQAHRLSVGGAGGSGLVNQHHHPHHSHQHHHQQHSGHHSNFGTHGTALMAGPAAMSPQGTVMMVYGLNSERMNCDRLFNLFCLYGNVVRVKFLRTKDGCAMVQMGDVLAVDRCVNSLNKITLFGSELQISYSKQAFLHDVLQPFTLPDGSPSFKDFMGNKNNRFKNPEVASKNRILPPSQVLHFFNAPQGIVEEELIQIFQQVAGLEPLSLKIFTPKSENSKSNSGLVTFRDPIEATEALILCNHVSMPRAGAPHPYILRLCYSPPTYARHMQQASHSQQQQAQQNSQEPASSNTAAPSGASPAALATGPPTAVAP